MLVPTETTDMAGHTVRVGDWVAMACTVYRSANLNIGRVVGFTETKMKLAIAFSTEDVRRHEANIKRVRERNPDYDPGPLEARLSSYESGVKKFLKIPAPVDFYDPMR